MGDTQHLHLRFDAFELDERDARLARDGRPVPLPPKAFAVLCALARQPGQLVTKSELLDAVWGHQHVSESVLKTTISEVRAALADDAKQPRFIETASRRGYRFIGSVRTQTIAATSLAPAAALPASAQSAPIIGRQAALARLRSTWSSAASGRRQVFWIAGEAGVGKTTLIDSFVAEIGPVACAVGQCVEQFGAGEPYLPVLEALGALSRKDQALVALMRAVAPAWLLQLPWLSSEQERASLQRELAGTSPDRMLRELGELLEQYTAQQPLLLISEDLHWCDQATVRLLDHIARRRGPARLMWLGSFRLAQLVSEDHPLKGLRHELRLHRLSDEIVLDPFSEQEVADYIDVRFPGTGHSEAFVRQLHARTDGLPLFLVNVVDDLVSQGAVGSNHVLPDSTERAWQVPENLAGVIEKQIARLPEDMRAILEVASVCGMEFRSQTVAEAIEREALWVGERCDELVRQQHWIAHVAVGGQPDGSLGARYVFRHALYRHVFYQRIGAIKRAQLHRNVGLSMERSRTAGVAVTATELASHYERGHDPMAALRHYGAAADSALSHFSPREAVDLTAHALTLLPLCPESVARLQLELALVMKRGVACSQLLGMASGEAKSAYERAQALCDLLPDTPALGWVLGGLGLARYGDGDYRATHALGARVQALAADHDEPGLQIAGRNLLGLACASLGDYRICRKWLEESIAICEAAGARLPHARFFVDPGVAMRGHLGLHLLPLGLFDQARAQGDAGLMRARGLDHPMAEALAIRCMGMIEMRLHRPELVASMAVTLEALATRHGIVQADAAARLLGGWAQAHLGNPDAGYARILEGDAILKRLGMIAGTTQTLCYAAEALILAGRWQEARMHVDEGLQLAQRLGERVRIPDLLLLQGQIALGQGQRDTARASMRASLDEARAQQALGYELPALVALCELDRATPAEREALGQAFGCVTEGFDTALVVRARQLLESVA